MTRFLKFFFGCVVAVVMNSYVEASVRPSVSRVVDNVCVENSVDVQQVVGVAPVEVTVVDVVRVNSPVRVVPGVVTNVVNAVVA